MVDFSSLPNHETVFSDSFPISRNCSPKFGVMSTPVTIPTSIYFQSVRRRWNPRVRCVRLVESGSSIGPLNLRQSTILPSIPARSSSVSSSIHFLCFLRLLGYRCSPSSLVPHLARASPTPPPACSLAGALNPSLASPTPWRLLCWERDRREVEGGRRSRFAESPPPSEMYK